jgi:hypothetical protein
MEVRSEWYRGIHIVLNESGLRKPDKVESTAVGFQTYKSILSTGVSRRSTLLMVILIGSANSPGSISIRRIFRPPQQLCRVFAEEAWTE